MYLQEYVDNGTRILNELDPKWYTKVNPETLDINSAKNCIIGDYNKGQDIILKHINLDRFIGWLYYGFTTYDTK